MRRAAVPYPVHASLRQSRQSRIKISAKPNEPFERAGWPSTVTPSLKRHLRLRHLRDFALVLDDYRDQAREQKQGTLRRRAHLREVLSFSPVRSDCQVIALLNLSSLAQSLRPVPQSNWNTLAITFCLASCAAGTADRTSVVFGAGAPMTAHRANVFDTSTKRNLARALTQRASASPLIVATAVRLVSAVIVSSGSDTHAVMQRQ
jgi:hypothetical protein